VNMYIGSTIVVRNAAGTDIEMVQETDYPWSGKIGIRVNPRERRQFTLRLRIPNRSTSELYKPEPVVNGLISLAVNGKRMRPVIENGYAVIARKWKPGDRVDLELPLKVQRVIPSGKIASTRGKMAIRYGPLIYNIEQPDQDITKSVAADAGLKPQWRSDLLGGVIAIQGKFADGSPLLAIPNYARLNRNPELPAEAGPLSASPELYLGGDSNPSAQSGSSQNGQRRAALNPKSVVWISRA
jgi:uncharacterized protein